MVEGATEEQERRDGGQDPAAPTGPPGGGASAPQNTGGEDGVHAAGGAVAPEGGVPAAVAVDGLTARGRSRLRRAWWAGAGPLLALYTAVLTGGRPDLLQRRFSSDFYDAQARAILDGRLNVPPEVAQMEGFVVGGRTYIYFGPFPSLIRSPVLAVSDGLDGRLSTLSMLAAMAVLAVAAFRLACALRAMVRGPAAVTHRERVATSVLAVAVLAGPPFFLASAITVYHEATLWGVALSVAGLDAVARRQLDPTARRLAVAGVITAAALLSRQSTALGPLVALGLAGIVPLLRADAAARGSGSPPGTRLRSATPPVLRLGAVLVLVVAPSVAVHHAKFGRLVGVPFDKQVYSQLSDDVAPGRGKVLETSPTLQGPEYVSTTALQYFRPDALELRPYLPWIDFPREGPTVVDPSVAFDTLDWSSSIPTTTPALTGSSLLAAGWAARRAWRRHGPRARRERERPADPEPGPAGDDPGREPEDGDAVTGAGSGPSGGGRPPAAPLAPLVLGSAAGAATVLGFAYVAHRYLNDIYPLVVVGGLIGAHLLLGAQGRSAGRSGRGGRPTRVVATILGLLVIPTVVVNLALTLVYQRDRGPDVPPEWRAEWVAWRLDLPGDPPVRRVASGADLPPVTDGGLLVVGDCRRLLTGVRDQWIPVEEAPGADVCHRVPPP